MIDGEARAVFRNRALPSIVPKCAAVFKPQARKILKNTRKEGTRMITFEALKQNEAIRAYIAKADESLQALGFTEHSFAHVCHAVSYAHLPAAGALSSETSPRSTRASNAVISEENSAALSDSEAIVA